MSSTPETQVTYTRLHGANFPQYSHLQKTNKKKCSCKTVVKNWIIRRSVSVHHTQHWSAVHLLGKHAAGDVNPLATCFVRPPCIFCNTLPRYDEKSYISQNTHGSCRQYVTTIELWTTVLLNEKLERTSLMNACKDAYGSQQEKIIWCAKTSQAKQQCQAAHCICAEQYNTSLLRNTSSCLLQQAQLSNIFNEMP
jgi:hypothetical protein